MVLSGRGVWTHPTGRVREGEVGLVKLGGLTAWTSSIIDEGQRFANDRISSI